jgi:hypothetical protein
MGKHTYEVVESKEMKTEVTTNVPMKIRAVVRRYKNGSYLWLPKEWAEKKVEITLVD